MQQASRVILLLSVAISAISAHDLYVLPEKFQVAAGETAIIGIHNGDDFPVAKTKTSLQRLRDPMIYSATEKSALPAPQLDGNRAVITTSTLDNGYRIVTIESPANVEKMNADEFLDYLEEESLNKIIDARAKTGDSAQAAMERYTKYSKSVFLAGEPDGFFSHVVGLPIEFIPEKDPLQVKAGEWLPVRLLFRGAPVGGLLVVAAHTTPNGTVTAPLGRTDAEGRILVPIDGASKWRLHAIEMEHSSDQEVADWESFWATLTFEIR